jgi:hypothetical protein
MAAFCREQEISMTNLDQKCPGGEAAHLQNATKNVLFMIE